MKPLSVAVCCRCRVVQTDENSGRRKVGRRVGKFQNYCRACGAQRSREWLKANPNWRAENLARCKKFEHKSRLKLKYGLTPLELERIIVQQDGKCAVCRAVFLDTKRRHIDHCHLTKKVRGLLCQRCNMALGLLDDSPERLHAAARYLEAALDRPSSDAVG